MQASRPFAMHSPLSSCLKRPRPCDADAQQPRAPSRPRSLFETVDAEWIIGPDFDTAVVEQPSIPQEWLGLPAKQEKDVEEEAFFFMKKNTTAPVLSFSLPPPQIVGEYVSPPCHVPTNVLYNRLQTQLSAPPNAYDGQLCAYRPSPPGHAELRRELWRLYEESKHSAVPPRFDAFPGSPQVALTTKALHLGQCLNISNQAFFYASKYFERYVSSDNAYINLSQTPEIRASNAHRLWCTSIVLATKADTRGLSPMSELSFKEVGRMSKIQPQELAKLELAMLKHFKFDQLRPLTVPDIHEAMLPFIFLSNTGLSQDTLPRSDGDENSGRSIEKLENYTLLSHFAEQLALYQLLEPELQHKGVFVQAIASLVAGVCFYLKRCSKNNKGGDTKDLPCTFGADATTWIPILCELALNVEQNDDGTYVSVPLEGQEQAAVSVEDKRQLEQLMDDVEDTIEVLFDDPAVLTAMLDRAAQLLPPTAVSKIRNHNIHVSS